MDNLWYILNRQIKGFYLSHRTESIIQITCIWESWRWSLFTVQELDVLSDGNSRIVLGISMSRNLTESCYQTSLPAFAYIFSASPYVPNSLLRDSILVTKEVRSKITCVQRGLLILFPKTCLILSPCRSLLHFITGLSPCEVMKTQFRSEIRNTYIIFKDTLDLPALMALPH